MPHYLATQLLSQLKQTQTKQSHHVDVIDLTNDSIPDAGPGRQLMPHHAAAHTAVPLTLLQRYPECFTVQTQRQLKYDINTKVLPSHIASKCIALRCDTATQHFLEQCCIDFNSSYASAYYVKNAFLKPLYKLYYSHTDVNGALGTGSMFVLSTEQCQQLLQQHIKNEPDRASLLDIGAGDGMVTKQLAPLFKHVYSTEVSASMVHTLRNVHHFTCYDSTDIPFVVNDVRQQMSNSTAPTVISLLNVIDRCDKPLTLLRDIYQCMSSDSILLLAVVLPLKPSVEQPDGRWLQPTEHIVTRHDACCMSFDEGLTALMEDVLQPIGYVLQSASRVPYLSAGDTVKPFYVLADAILVLGKHS